MKCPVVKRYLFRLENPDRPCQAVRDHLSRCAPCHALHAGLLKMEHDVRLLQVPHSATKESFVRQFQSGTLGSPKSVKEGWLPWQLRDRASRKLALAASLAAAIV